MHERNNLLIAHLKLTQCFLLIILQIGSVGWALFFPLAHRKARELMMLWDFFLLR